jgi:hypothetical protein
MYGEGGGRGRKIKRKRKTEHRDTRTNGGDEDEKRLVDKLDLGEERKTLKRKKKTEDQVSKREVPERTRERERERELYSDGPFDPLSTWVRPR